MGEHASWATMNGNERIVDVEDSRLALGALWMPGNSAVNAREGIRVGPDAPGRVYASFPTADGKVHVAAFQGVLAASRGVGNYGTTLDADKTIDVLTANPADPSNDRIDLVIEQQTDTFYNDPATAYEVKRIVGDPAAAPVDPIAKITSPDYRILARVRVPAGATALNDADIDNVDAPWTVAAGGILPIRSLDERAAIEGTYDGMTIYRQDKGWIEVSDGASWRIRGVASIADFADVTNPWTGQMVYHIGNRLTYRYNGSGWSLLGTVGGRIVTTAGSIHTGIAATEVNITKLALENSRVIAGGFYTFNVNLYVNFSAAGDAFIVRVRKDTPLTGPVVAEWQWDSTIALDDTRTFAQPWRSSATDTDADFYVSAQRILGGGTMGIYGNRRAAFWIDDNGGDGAAWIEVP